MARTSTRPVALRGVEMPAGAKVVLLLGSGNRDPREFDDAGENLHLAGTIDVAIPSDARHVAECS